MQAAPIQLAVFDLAGTTVRDDRYVHRVLQKSLSAFGLEVSLEEVNEVMGLPKPVAIARLLQSNNLWDDFHVLIPQIHTDFEERMIQFYARGEGVEEMPGVSQLFRSLREAGIKVAVDTGFSRLIAKSLIERMGWQEQGLIDASVTSDEVERGRPFPDMIYRVMEVTGVLQPGLVAKVGDTPSDLLEGTAANCGVVAGVGWGAFPADELRKFPHTHILQTLDELVGVVAIPA